jgi:acyl-homoserine-lactone acylase
MDMYGENFRGIHALQLLEGSSGWTREKLQAAAYDENQPGFAALVPQLVKAYDALPKVSADREALAGPIAVLRKWDYRWGAKSVAQSLAMAWGNILKAGIARPSGEPGNKTMMRLGRDTTAAQKIAALKSAVTMLRSDFGTWQIPWGEINRDQRISAAIDPVYNDAAPSIPVPVADANYGSLASIRSLPRPGTKKWYGDFGNSFVAVVEFGPKVRARAITAGGESGHPDSPHFNDEAVRYAAGALREVYFTPEQLKGHTERRNHPGE